MRLPDWVALRAATHPSTIAVEASDATLTYSELDDRVGRAAAALRRAGARQGDRVALLAEASAAYAVAVHAIARTGSAVVPLNARLTLEERAWQLGDCNARLLLADETTDADTATNIERLTLDGSPWTGEEQLEPSERESDEAFCLVYSSGTTGHPKAVVLTAGNVYWSAVGSAENLGVDSADRWLACMPLFHVGGLSILVRSAIYGTTAVIHPRFDPAEVARALREERVSLLSVVPTMLARLLQLPELEAPQLRAVLVGGGAAAPALLAEARTRGLPALATFGLSEAASQVTTQRLDAAPVEGSSGPPMAVTTLRADLDARVEPGDVGDLLAAGPTVMREYWRRPEATADALAGGWLRTGDHGYLDAAGELHVVDRRDDLIVSGGENIYPAEVEQALESHPAVEECAVVGLPDPDYGQRVTAIVVTREAATAEELDRHLRASLAGYKVPRRYDFVEGPLPRTELGKLLRRELRASLDG